VTSVLAFAFPLKTAPPEKVSPPAAATADDPIDAGDACAASSVQCAQGRVGDGVLGAEGAEDGDGDWADEDEDEDEDAEKGGDAGTTDAFPDRLADAPSLAPPPPATAVATLDVVGKTCTAEGAASPPSLGTASNLASWKAGEVEGIACQKSQG